MKHNNRHCWAVIGGGVSGIAAAHYLEQAGLHVEIIDRESVLGGRVGVRELNGEPIELGGKNIGHGYRLFREFVASLGDYPYEHIGVNNARVENGQFKTLDSSRRWRSFVMQLRRRSPTDLARFARMALRVKREEREGFLGGEGFRREASRLGDPTALGYFSRAFCQDALRLMSLMMTAAEPDEIHVGNLGTNIRMALDDYDQLQRGMGDVFAQFGKRVATRLRTRVESLIVRDGQVVGLRLMEPGQQAEEVAYDGVVLATTAHAAADLSGPHYPDLARELREVRYYPTAVVVAEYAHDVFNPAVRALRFDEPDPLANARAYGKNQLNVIRYTFSGRCARPLLEGAIDRDALLDRAEASLGKYFPVSRSARRGAVVPERALELCAYSPHHAARLDRLAAATPDFAGLHLTGDYLRGTSIEACFHAARECAGRLLRNIDTDNRRVMPSTPQDTVRHAQSLA